MEWRSGADWRARGEAPVQLDRHPRYPRLVGVISWETHERAWREYARRFGTAQSAETMAGRWGFGESELDDFLGPGNWSLLREEPA